MADQHDVLQRLEDIESRVEEAGVVMLRGDVNELLSLCHSLLESQGELLKCLEDEHESEFMGTHGCTQERPGRPCSTCALLTRAEAVRRARPAPRGPRDAHQQCRSCHLHL